MSNNTIIKVEGLSKQYLLNKSASPKSDTLFDNLLTGVKNIKNIARKKETQEFHEFKSLTLTL